MMMKVMRKFTTPTFKTKNISCCCISPVFTCNQTKTTARTFHKATVTHESQKALFASVLTRNMVGQPFPHSHPHLLARDPTRTNNNIMDDEIAVGFTRGEFVTRRQKLREQILLHENQFVILGAYVQSIMTNDIPYTYRPDSNLYYLTGCMEHHAILLLGKDKEANYLFVKEKNGLEEQWGGPRSGVNAMRNLINGENNFNGDLQVESMERFPIVLKSLLQRCKNKETTTEPVTLFMDPKKNEDVTQQVINSAGGGQNFATSVLDAQKNGKIVVLMPDGIMNTMRGIKSEQEIAILRKTAEISNRAFRATMSATRAGMSEAHLEAIMEFHVRLQGAQRLAYPPVVATGDNANVVHYVRNNSLLQDGELVLIDGGAEYFQYPSDVTRSWPVSGQFTHAQKLLYQAVLDVNKSCLNYLEQAIKQKKKVSISSIHQFSVEETNRHIVETLGLNPRNEEIMSALYPHTIGHPLGMDIHEEVPAWDELLKPGMVITIEPGIYIPKDGGDLVGSSNKGLLGNGVRIEDNVLILEDGIEVLTRYIPKEIDEVEAACQQENGLNRYIHDHHLH